MASSSSDGKQGSKTSVNSSFSFTSCNSSASAANLSRSLSCTKTPGRTTKTPRKTPSKTPGRPSPVGGDRFIPLRTQARFDVAYFQLMKNEKNEVETSKAGDEEYNRGMAENLGSGLAEDNKIFTYYQKAPTAPSGHNNVLKAVYQNGRTPASSGIKNVRHIPQVPDRILDAPDIVDDYYLNLMDWGVKNQLVVALGSNVYIWDANDGTVSHLVDVREDSQYVCSVQWMPQASHVAVGTESGVVQLYDVVKQKKVRNLDGHSMRVGALSWNQYMLSSGSRTGTIIHHDVRVPNALISKIPRAHSLEICGLRWSHDGCYLASGGNDNILNIWPASPGEKYSEQTPIYRFSDHQAAVKALAWCPWQRGMLASGGGTADRCIRFWSTSSGRCLNTIDTKSQVSAVLWSTEYKELISSHGFAKNELIIWRYPAMTKVAELLGHTSRVLNLTMSPDGSTVASAGVDETIRLWRCFIPDQKKKSPVCAKPRSAIALGHIR